MFNDIAFAKNKLSVCIKLFVILTTALSKFTSSSSKIVKESSMNEPAWPSLNTVLATLPPDITGLSLTAVILTILVIVLEKDFPTLSEPASLTLISI